MATRKPSAAQLAARKTFADMARSGAFKKRKKPAAKKAARNPRSRAQDLAIAMAEKRAGHPRKAKEFFERAARAPRKTVKRNPHKAPVRYKVHHANVHGEPTTEIASFLKKTEAVEYAKAYATQHKRPVVIVGKGL